MSANEFESDLEKEKQLDKNKPDFKSRTKAAVFFQPITKEIYLNKKRENKLRNIYKRRSVLSARKQKLATKKLEKKASKTYNIKALWQRNRDLYLNFKANNPVSELAESLKSVLSEKTNFAYLFSDFT